jgi:uncharacterized protein
MAAATLIVELIFDLFGLIPTERSARVIEASITWNYTTWLNIALLALVVVLVWPFPEHFRLTWSRGHSS